MALAPIAKTRFSISSIGQRAVPRSIVAWFVVCWAAFLLASIVAGALLLSLYRQSTTEQLRHAQAPEFLYGKSLSRRSGVDKALRVALRIMEERADFVEKMADNSGEAGATRRRPPTSGDYRLNPYCASGHYRNNRTVGSRNRDAAHQSHHHRFCGVGR